MFDFNIGPLPDGVVRAINQSSCLSVRPFVCPSDSVEGTCSTTTLLILEREIEGQGGLNCKNNTGHFQKRHTQHNDRNHTVSKLCGTPLHV